MNSIGKLSEFKSMELDSNLNDVVNGILGFDIYVNKYKLNNREFVDEAVKNLHLYLEDPNHNGLNKIKRYSHYLNEL
jgi:hypothetical protein